MVYPNISQWKSIKKLFTVIPKINPILTDYDSNHDDPKVGMITKPTPVPRNQMFLPESWAPSSTGFAREP